MKNFYYCVLALFLFVNSSAQEINQLTKTPPMGWNSWNCFGMDVIEDQVKSNADYMAKYLKNYGWEYVIVDMGWHWGEGLNTNNFRMINPPQNIDEYGRVIPSELKFPSAASGQGFKPLADYIHSLGLKFGIHIMRGIPRKAVEQNSPIKGTCYRAKDIINYADTCTWFNGMITIDMTKPGAQEYYNSLIELYLEWGVDFVKADDMLNPYHEREIEGFNKAVINAAKPIVISLSPGPVSNSRASHLQQNAHMWRISGDMWDDWSYIKQTFEICRKWQHHRQPNTWPDCDILPLGKLRINGTDGALAKKLNKQFNETINEFSRLTNDEKYTLLTLWTIFRSPLMMGGNLLENDELTVQLLTNKEVLAINQNSINNKEIRANDKEIVWTAEDPETNAIYVAMFNIDDNESRQIKIKWNELGISGKYNVRDLWHPVNIGNSKGNLKALIVPHGCGLFKLSK